MLGLLVEVQFHGPTHEYANTFANIDRCLRGLGFSLFGADLYHYSRSALPSPFVWNLPAQTLSGQVVAGDALYLRDLGDPAYEQKHRFAVSPDRVMKLAGLFAAFNLPDCAAELLIGRLPADHPLLDSLLAAAAEDAGVPNGDYKAHMAAFERNPRDFYRSAREPETITAIAAAPPPATDEDARVRLEEAIALIERLKLRLRESKQKHQDLRRKFKQRLRDRNSGASVGG